MITQLQANSIAHVKVRPQKEQQVYGPLGAAKASINAYWQKVCDLYSAFMYHRPVPLAALVDSIRKSCQVFYRHAVCMYTPQI